MESVVRNYGPSGGLRPFASSISGVGLEGWENITKRAPAVEYDAKVLLFEQGALPTIVFLVDRGLIKLTRLTEDGVELIVGLRSAGAILGADSAIAQQNHPLSALTITPCILRRVDIRLFITLARTDPEMSWYLHKMQSLEVHSHGRQLADFKSLSARQRLKNLIWQILCSNDLGTLGKTVKITLPLKRWEIAQLIGVTPEHLCRVMKELESDEIVRTDGSSLIIQDINAICSSID